MKVLILSLLSLSLVTQVTVGCPSQSWIHCAYAGSTCEIPASINATTIAYGDDDNQIWTMTDFSNLGANMGKSMSVKCTDYNFGDPDSGASKECCFTAQGPLFTVSLSQSTNWSFIADGESSEWYNVPYTGYPRWVRYGSYVNGQYSYRLIDNSFQCRREVFGDPTNGANGNGCWAYNYVFNISKNDFLTCGDKPGGTCTLTVDSDQMDLIRLTALGLPMDTAGAQNYYYRFVYSAMEGSVPCTTNLFYDPPLNGDTCIVAKASDMSLFVNPVGMWELVGWCDGCTISKSLSYGVTSTSSHSKTTTWSHSLTETLSLGLKWKFLSVGFDLSHTASTSISNTMSDSFSVSVTETCSASCGSEVDTWNLWQWQMNIGEIVETDVVPFLAYGCYFICTNNTQVQPQCPLNYCKNSDCSVCYPWNTTSVAPPKYNHKNAMKNPFRHL